MYRHRTVTLVVFLAVAALAVNAMKARINVAKFDIILIIMFCDDKRWLA